MQTLQRWAAVIFGGMAALGLLTVSVASNFQFGLLLADGPERWIWAGAGAFLDCLKTLLPIIIAASLAAGAFVRGGIATLLFALSPNARQPAGCFAAFTLPSMMRIRAIRIEFLLSAGSDFSLQSHLSRIANALSKTLSALPNGLNQENP